MQIAQSTSYNRPFFIGTTGLTITMTLSKNGGGFNSSSGSVTEISAGWYYVALDATDTNTLGGLAYVPTGSGLPTFLGLPADQIVGQLSISGVVVE
jgi:hypothetical protein